MQSETAPAMQRLVLASTPDREASVTALLRLFSESGSRKEYLDGAVRLLQEWSGCRCAGIRVLDPDGNIPYESYTGFSQEFWASENWLSVRDDQCICIRVIKGAPEPQDLATITSFGSFACGNTMDFVGGLSAESQTRYRGVCVRTGFTSVAVVPICHRGQTLGAIHLADERADWLPQAKVELVEMVAPLTGEAIHRFGLEEELRRNCAFQAASNRLLRLSLDDVPVEDIVREAGETLSGLPWLSFEPEVGIELCEPGGEIPPTVRGCYVAPIQSGGVALGHVVIRRREDANRRSQEEEVLNGIADILAGMITAKRAQAERLQMEERLLRAHRLEMAGRVAGQVAHDLNNLLTPLVAYPQLIKRHLPADHPAVAYCDTQIQVARQMVTISEDLLTLGRRGQMRMQALDVNQVVGMALSEMSDQGGSIVLDAVLAPDLPEVRGAPFQLLRVVSNLISNAREAMGDRGRLTVRTGLVCLEERSGHYGQIAPGLYVRLSVRDTGGGIPAEIRDQIFDPFFSTKQSGRKSGSGLGLSIVQAIVEDHGGQVDVVSEVGVGTAFEVYLPVETGIQTG